MAVTLHQKPHKCKQKTLKRYLYEQDGKLFQLSFTPVTKTARWIFQGLKTISLLKKVLAFMALASENSSCDGRAGIK
jgi:hypothetical protein